MQGIFISYRRQDSQSAAGRLADHLKEHLSGASIFRDVETIEAGVDFVDAIQRALSSCGVLLAIIGPRWISVTDAAGRRRLDDPHDYTRLEVAAALARPQVRVIPVLVDGAQMPATQELPDDLKPLSRRNAIELTDKRWDYDVGQLAETLRRALGLPDNPRPGPAPTPPRPTPVQKTGWPRWKWLAAGVAGLAVLGSLGNLMDTTPSGGNEPLPNLPEAPVELPPTDSIAPVVASPPPAPIQALNLSGNWVDSMGGQHQVVHQGNRIVIQGMSPDGYVSGTGQMQGHSGWLEYTLNGYPLRADLAVGADGRQIQVVATDPGTGQRYALVMTRVN